MYVFYCRIRTELNGGAWCPQGPIDETSYEYLQISFTQLKVITLVETQGRFGNGQVNSLITHIQRKSLPYTFDSCGIIDFNLG